MRWRTRKSARILAVGTILVLGLVGFGCGEGGDKKEMTKDEARGMGAADWTEDWCEYMGWYGDGVCDEFCPSPDPDCSHSQACGPWLDGACPDGMVCDIHGCGIGTGGECVQRGDVCYELYAPVCGCDGQTYGNDCERLQTGVALDHEGECEGENPTCHDPDDPDVNYVSQDLSECAVILYDCPEGWTGFSDACGCGCIKQKTCGPWMDGFCDDGYVCNIHGCGVGAGGVCVVQGDACYELYAPVCGCDGETYGNDCERIQAGVPLDHEGECEADPVCPDPDDPDVQYMSHDVGECATMLFECDEGWAGFTNQCGCGCIKQQTCGPWMDGSCDDGYVCNIHGCGMGTGGVCVPHMDACYELYAPVCGCDGETYGNDCFRVMAGAALDHEGEC